jgi:hypothetical protein
MFEGTPLLLRVSALVVSFHAVLGAPTVTITASPAYNAAFSCTTCPCAAFDALVDAEKRVSSVPFFVVADVAALMLHCTQLPRQSSARKGQTRNLKLARR